MPWVPIALKYVNMTDVNSSSVIASPVHGVGGDARPDEPALVAMVELLFFAYRDFVAGPDEILSELGFGRAHHRVLHFVSRNPGLRVADLLGILKITKQSLARVLKQLVDEGYVQQETGANDRRERRLHLTERGKRLAARLLALQTRQLGDALAGSGAGAREAAAAFLAGVIAPADAEKAAELVERALSDEVGP